MDEPWHDKWEEGIWVCRPNKPTEPYLMTKNENEVALWVLRGWTIWLALPSNGDRIEPWKIIQP